MILSFLLISQEIGILRESIIYQGHSISSWKKLGWKPSLTLESRLQAVGTLPFAHPLLALPAKVILQWVRLSPCVVSLAAQSCPTFCDTTDCSMPGFPVHHQLLELAQTHVHWLKDWCCPLFLPPSILPSIRVFSNESTLRMRWPKYWSFSFSISPSNEYSGHNNNITYLRRTGPYYFALAWWASGYLDFKPQF